MADLNNLNKTNCNMKRILFFFLIIPIILMAEQPEKWNTRINPKKEE
jgi:hypothetical protein